MSAPTTYQGPSVASVAARTAVGVAVGTLIGTLLCPGPGSALGAKIGAGSSGG